LITITYRTFSPWTESSDCINPREQTFGVISVAHAQIAFGQSTLFTRPIQREHNPACQFLGSSTPTSLEQRLAAELAADVDDCSGKGSDLINLARSY